MLQSIKNDKSMTDEQKIVFAHTNGFTYRDIKYGLQFGSTKVSRVLNQYKENHTIAEKAKIGAPKKLTPNVLLDINSMIRENAKTTLNKMSQTISNKESISISKTTISRGCNILRYKYKPPQRTINLSEIQKINRVNFSKTMLSKSFRKKIDLFNIIFSDESRFVLGDDKQWVWRRYGERNPTAQRKTDKYPPSLMIYGAFGFGYKSHLVFVDTSINSIIYKRNIIQSGMIDHMNHVKGRGNWIFMQDGARCHTSRETIRWLEHQCLFIRKWPSNSPDLNPIENFWACMKEAVAKFQPKTINELRSVILDVWESFDQNSIDNLVASFYQRLILVIQHNGECIQPWITKDLHKLNIMLPQIEDFGNEIPNVLSILKEPIIENPVPANTKFTKEDEKIIMDIFIKNGPKWTKMSQVLPNHTINQIKQHFRQMLKKKYILTEK